MTTSNKPEPSADLYLLLGRMDGKMDMITTIVSQTASRVDNLETRINHVEQQASAIQAAGKSNHNWLGYLAGFGALIISVVGVFFGKSL